MGAGAHRSVADPCLAPTGMPHSAVQKGRGFCFTFCHLGCQNRGLTCVRLKQALAFPGPRSIPNHLLPTCATSFHTWSFGFGRVIQTGSGLKFAHQDSRGSTVLVVH